MNKNITFKIVIMIAFLFFATALPTYFIFETETKKISENLGTKLAIEKIQHNNFHAISKLNREIALVDKMAHSALIVKWLKDENNQNAKKDAFVEIESFRKIFADKSYFLASKNSKSYYYNDANATYTNKEKLFELSEKNPKDQWFFETLKAGKELQLNVDSNWKLGVVKVWLNQIVFDEHGESLGILGTGIDLSSFISEVLASNDDGINSFFIDKSGNIQAHKDIKMIDFSTISKKESDHKNIYSIFKNENDINVFEQKIQELLDGKQIYLTTKLKIDGSVKLVVLSKIENIDWIIVSVVEFDKLVSDDYFDNLIIVALCAFCIFVFFTVLNLNKLVLKPIRKLDNIVDKVMHGNYNIEFKITTTDEIGRLCEHFREMTDKIKQQTHWLEDQVEKRTSELNLANKELKIFINDFDKNVIFSRIDKSGIINYASKAFQKISGYNEAKLLGKSHNVVGHPEMSRAFFEDMWEKLISGNVWQGEIKNKNKNGDVYWLETTIEPFHSLSGEHIGYRAISQNITVKKQIQDLSEKVQNLLDNAEEGFLSFSKDLIVESGYSKECRKIFAQEIEGCKITDLVFGQNYENFDLAQSVFEKVFDIEDSDTQEVILSLLPTVENIFDKTISMKFKMISKNKCMLIISDITEKIILEQEIREQQEIQKMIVAMVSNKNEFLEIKSEFLEFNKNYKQKLTVNGDVKHNLTYLLREFHTFKGLFSQKECIKTVNAIHNLETKIKDLLEIEAVSLDEVFTLIDGSNLGLVLEEEIERIFKKTGLKISMNDFGCEISLYEILLNYSGYAKKIAMELEKEINSFQIFGDEKLLISDKFKPFVKSLVNVFKNSIDHAIETPQERFEKSKELFGTITCKFEIDGNKLILEISDDGKGIDLDELIKKAIQKGIVSQKEADGLSQKEKLDLIFCDNLSTKDEITLISGRGIGLSAVKQEVDLLGGNIQLENKKDEGLTFRFLLPL